MANTQKNRIISVVNVVKKIDMTKNEYEYDKKCRKFNSMNPVDFIKYRGLTKDEVIKELCNDGFYDCFNIIFLEEGVPFIDTLTIKNPPIMFVTLNKSGKVINI